MRSALVAVVVVFLAVATACGGADSGSGSAAGRPTTRTRSVSVAPPPTTTTTTTTPVAGTPPARTTTVPPSPAVCTVGDLQVSLGAEEGTAGTLYRALVFTNAGQRTCVIQGFPGVSFVTGDDGHQVGQPAVRVDQKGPPVTLRPGMTANAAVGFVNAGVFDPRTCQPTPVRGLRVYPPHERRSVFVPFETTGCAGFLPGNHQLTVRTVREGAGLT